MRSAGDKPPRVAGSYAKRRGQTIAESQAAMRSAGETIAEKQKDAPLDDERRVCPAV